MSSSTGGGYAQEYYTFINSFNKLLDVKADKEVDWKAVSKELTRFADQRNSELSPNSPYKWCSPYLISKPNAICIFAHSKHPTRCMALIDTANATFIRLEPCEKKGLNSGRKLGPTANKLQLASTKRGFWLALKPMKDANYTKESLSDEEKLKQLLDYYDNHVAGMEKNPFKGDQAKLPWKQQFDLSKYPTTAWASIVAAENTVVKDPGNTKKRKRLDYAGESSKQPRICDLVAADEEVPKYVDHLAKEQETSAVSILMKLKETKFDADEIDISKEMEMMQREQQENEISFLKSCDLGNCGLDDESLGVKPGEEEEFKFDFGDL